MSDKQNKNTEEEEEEEERKKRVSEEKNAQELIRMLKASGVTDAEGLQDETHAFWDTQPMPHLGTNADLPEGPVVTNEAVQEKLRADPYTMPGGFEWTNVDIVNDDQRLELYNLLAQNYVEDDDALFRFDYSHAFLKWALTPPGWTQNFMLGVRATKTKKLVAFISAVPANIKVRATSSLPVVEINFLCVHKKLRAKRLAPVLIKEITRRVNHTGVYQAVYTAGVVLPVPVASARYFHRSLNPKKLVRIHFSRPNPRMTLARMQKLYKLPQEPVHEGWVPMSPAHLKSVHSLLTKHQTESGKLQLHLNFTEEEIGHWLMPRDQVIYTYVLPKPNDPNDVSDLISFYHLPSSVLGTDERLHAAYSYYNVATSMTMKELLQDALILAARQNAGGLAFDVFNALSLVQSDNGDNDATDLLESLKFGKGDGNLQYYIYNWSTPSMSPQEVGIVLL